MFIIGGKTCSGKNKVALELTKRGYKRCILYTTRPVREKEKQDVDYHFITDEKFERMEKEGFFAETKTYSTVFGEWRYGSAIEDYKDDDKLFIILTPDGIASVKSKLSFSPKIIYLYANNRTIEERLKARGDNANEAKRRIVSDNADFKGFDRIADRIVYNNLSNNIVEVANKIEAFLHSGGKDGVDKKDVKA